jgi:tripartite-type tricarboxylate transporter receptor subunit TctC
MKTSTSEAAAAPSTIAPERAAPETAAPDGSRRRLVLAPLAASVVGLAAPLHGVAQPASYPSRPLRFLQPFSAGSGPDITSRFVLKGMAEKLGQNIVVENKVGAVGMIAMGELAKAPADGYTFAYTNIAIAVSQALLGKGGFHLARDVTPIGGLAYSYNVLVVAPTVPARDVRELVKLVRAKPGDFSYGSGGNGTPAHLNGEIFKRSNGLDVVHVPYKGLAAAINDLTRGDIHYMFGISTAMTPAIAAGRIRALAVAAPHRLAALPAVPTMEEAGFRGNDVRSWTGFAAPAGTPSPIIARLHQALAEVLAEPATAKFLEINGAEPAPVGPAEYGELMVAESSRWEAFIREAGLKID